MQATQTTRFFLKKNEKLRIKNKKNKTNENSTGQYAGDPDYEVSFKNIKKKKEKRKKKKKDEESAGEYAGDPDYQVFFFFADCVCVCV